MSWAREATPLEITEWLLRQPPPVTRGLVVNMPASTSVELRLFQAAMYRDNAMTIKYDRGSQRGTDVGKRWLLEIWRYTCEDCIRRARANLYLARRLNRKPLSNIHRPEGSA